MSLVSSTHNNKGNDKAMEMLFAGIFRQHEHKLHTLALKLTKSDQYAKDIIQDVFIKLWEHRHEMHTIRNMEAWLYRLTENRVIDFLRKAAADDRLKKALLHNISLMHRDTESLIEAREYDHIIQMAIDSLPPKRKLIYRLSKQEGWNYSEIAEKLSISQHTVKNHLSGAIRAIRRFIAGGILLLYFFF